MTLYWFFTGLCDFRFLSLYPSDQPVLTDPWPSSRTCIPFPLTHCSPKVYERYILGSVPFRGVRSVGTLIISVDGSLTRFEVFSLSVSGCLKVWDSSTLYHGKTLESGVSDGSSFSPSVRESRWDFCLEWRGWRHSTTPWFYTPLVSGVSTDG